MRNSRESFVNLNEDYSQNPKQADISGLKNGLPEVNNAESNSKSTKAVEAPIFSSIIQRIYVLETAAVMEAIMDWLYEDRIFEDSDMFADIYRAASKYKLEELCNYIVSQIEHYEDDAKFVTSMMKIALEHKDEKLIRELVPIFKANTVLHKSSELEAQLSQYKL